MSLQLIERTSERCRESSRGETKAQHQCVTDNSLQAKIASERTALVRINWPDWTAKLQVITILLFVRVSVMRESFTRNVSHNTIGFCPRILTSIAAIDFDQ